ncbi:MAG TPA: DUF5011 domain-containing protein [Cyclobacteriaceae bacterium]|nr:DUF5011 domain-containing protein [Cyclobacteriaceae bacterium]
MKISIRIICVLLFACIFSACERTLESEGIAEGIIRYPSITLNEGDAYSIVAGGGEFEDPGAVALLGEDDISSEIVVDGEVDTSTPGVYPIDYTVSVENEIGQQSTVTETRFVIVTSEDLSDVDLSGDYVGTGFAGNPSTVHVTKLADGWYNIPDVLSSANGISVNFAHIGGNEIMIPDQETPFGVVSTDAPGASATLTANGFTWTVFISCCGNFGPIVFVKQ